MPQSIESKPCRTREELLKMFESQGVTVTDWARANGFPANIVYTLLSGRARGKRGKTHEAAIALGLKSPPDLSDRLLEGPLTNPQRSNP